MKPTVIFACSLLALVGCSTPESRERDALIQHIQYLGKQAVIITVDPSDGISEEEAYKIGVDRFATYGTDCGVASVPVDLGDHWRVTTYVGIAAVPSEDILIRKSDGQTTINRAKTYWIPTSDAKSAAPDELKTK